LSHCFGWLLHQLSSCEEAVAGGLLETQAVAESIIAAKVAA
jgi:hypothetical protein